MSTEDDFDTLPDLFTGLTEAEWSRILDHHPIPATRSTSSADYAEDDSFMDPEALAELDRIEAQALQTSGVVSTRGAALQNNTPLSPTSANPGLSHYFATAGSRVPMVEAPPRAIVNTAASNPPRSVQQRHQMSMENSCRTSISPQKNKGKTRADEITIQRLVDGYEEEMTCPICCDLFVATHVGNPCGHSYCGDCGWQWFKKNKQHQCPVCRAPLFEGKPLIPNIAMDNLVEKHVGQLGLAGDEDWQSHGSKFKEWTGRNEKWKATGGVRLKAKRTRKVHIRPVLIDDLPGSGADEILRIPARNGDDESSSYVGSSSSEYVQLESARYHPDRPPRSRRRRR